MSLSFAIDSLPPSSADDLELDRRTDAELDTLPFGVICVDREGTILRYNLTESRFARLDRAQVYGKRFYGTVAHCCDTPDFRGRVEAFFDDPDAPRSDRFDYVFDFRFGAQLVDIELARSSDPGRVYILVRRKRFADRRSDVPESFLGIAQDQLAPGERDRGVDRDDHERRKLALSPVVFEALMTVLAGRDEGPPLLSAWGVTWGRRAVIDLETEVMARQDRVLRELTMVEAVDAIADHVAVQGWGELSVDFGPARHGAFVVDLARNALAEALPRGSRRRCHLLAGFFEAVFGHIAGRRLCVREAACIAGGAERCSFVVVGEAREAALEAVVDEANGDLERLAAALEEMP